MYIIHREITRSQLGHRRNKKYPIILDPKNVNVGSREIFSLMLLPTNIGDMPIINDAKASRLADDTSDLIRQILYNLTDDKL